ncbi:MAG: YicC family protein [Ruminococcaceae bacterium]|nr:YicC family protein [Oscillospiraceae bacterium]
MTRSMTAYGRCVGTANGKNITAEIKSVNSRFLDCSVKVSRAYSFLEEKIAAYIRSRGIVRGKVDVYVGIEQVEKQGVRIDLDPAYTEGYIAALRTLRDSFALPDDISVMSVAQNRDIFVITKPEEDAERDWQDVLTVLEPCVESFLARREAEGENLKNDLMEKKANLMKMAAAAKEKAEENAKSYEEKFRTRLAELMADTGVQPDPARVLTEVAVYVDKIAVDEELVRLSSHFRAYDDIFASGEPQGRKLDFLLQEINREINTLGSKSLDSSLSHLVVEMKSELEKIREQIQNIE